MISAVFLWQGSFSNASKTRRVMAEENKQELKPCLRMYDFFSHMSDYHGLTLTDTEMHDIISVCAKYADSKQEVCTWTKQEDSDEYGTSCNRAYWFEDDDAEGPGWRFCPFCGNKIEVK